MRQRHGLGLEAVCNPNTVGQHPRRVADDVHGFVEQHVFGVLARFFSCQIDGEIAFVGLQAVIPERIALSRGRLDTRLRCRDARTAIPG